uniref:Death domain-containing protein n=1 Tax=Amphimedon queenslandica TaxID=400682 RepID=A0A1X7SN97_AMPQE
MAVAGRRVFRLDISHMKLVRDVLKESHFIDANWFDLGEELNLPYPQLKNIEDTYVNNPSRCLRECLSLWLTSANNRTWESLASALERMNQKPAATHIRETYELIPKFVDLSTISNNDTVPTPLGTRICKTQSLAYLYYISVIFIFLSIIINYFYYFSILVYLCIFIIILLLLFLYYVISFIDTRQSKTSISTARTTVRPVTSSTLDESTASADKFFFNAAHQSIFNEIR